jgi:hypothetical protein
MTGIATGPIRTVTIATTDLDGLVDTYERCLAYGTVERGTVPAAQAASWNAPAVAGRRYALLSPAGSGDAYLRFVESRRPDGYVAFRHLGWNAAEHIVQNCDSLGECLKQSPFEIIGPPENLSFSDQFRAMQVRGPADEVLYLTEIKSKLPIFDTPEARFPVDRVFIVILGGRSIDELQDWYEKHLGVPRAPVIPSRISVLANTYGESTDTLYSIAALPLSRQAFIEADAMPSAALPRPCLPGELPPAIAMVSFEVDALPDGLAWFAPPQRFDGLANAGARSAVCRGPAGELIELIERA